MEILAMLAPIIGAIILALLKGLTHETKKTIEVRDVHGESLGPRISNGLRDLAER